MKRLVLPLLVAVVMACGGTPSWADTPPGTGNDPALAGDTQPGYQGQSTCSPAPKPGAVALLGLLVQRWGGSSWGISRGCAVGGRSEHKEGRALDWHMDVANPADRTRVAEALDWLTADGGEVAERLGVMYIIWNQRVWSSYRQSDGWRPMADRGSYTANHFDHVHISLTWDGAMQQTSWWTGVPVTRPLTGPCGVGGAPVCRALTEQAMLGMLLDGPDHLIRPESLPAPAEIPLIGGIPKVGHLLQVVPGTWVPVGAELAFQWIRDGIPIPGANDPTHAVTTLDLDTRLRVRVLAFAPDGSVGIQLSDELPTVDPAEFRVVPVPRILGEPGVGRLLSVDPGSWRPFPAATAFQWYRDGSPIRGATGFDHHLTAADLAHRITVTVTASAPGFTTTRTTSAPTSPVGTGALVAPVPVVEGDHVQGRKLTAVAGNWGPAPVELSYQWLRDGRPIKAATRATYRLTEADVGSAIRVRVRGSRPGYSVASVVSVADRQVQRASEPATASPISTPTPSPTSTPSTPPAPAPHTTPSSSPSPSLTATPQPAEPGPQGPPTPTGVPTPSAPDAAPGTPSPLPGEG